MSIPAMIYLALTFLGLGIHLAKHGQKRSQEWNFLGALIANGLIICLLYWGGFFASVPK